MKLVDTLDLGSSAVRLGGSSPSTRTIKRNLALGSDFFFLVIKHFRIRAESRDHSVSGIERRATGHFRKQSLISI